MKPTAFTLILLKRLSLASGRSQVAILDRLVRAEFVRECEDHKLDPDAIIAGWRSPLPEALAEVAELDPERTETHADVVRASNLPARAIAKALRSAGVSDVNMRRNGKTYRAWRGIRLR